MLFARCRGDSPVCQWLPDLVLIPPPPPLQPCPGSFCLCAFPHTSLKAPHFPRSRGRLLQSWRLWETWAQSIRIIFYGKWSGLRGPMLNWTHPPDTAKEKLHTPDSQRIICFSTSMFQTKSRLRDISLRDRLEYFSMFFLISGFANVSEWEFRFS